MKKLFALLMALIIALSLMTFPVSGEERQSTTLTTTILGDSIASGYGLKSMEDSYAYIIGETKFYDTRNCAVPGHTTTDLVNLIKNNNTVKNNIAVSDLIIVSIGGNDLLGLLQGGTNTTVLFDIMLNGANSKYVKEALSVMESNLHEVLREIRKYNTMGTVVFQTVYNPIYAHPQFSAYAPTLDKLAPAFNNLFTELAKSNSRVYVSDIFTAFDTYFKTTGKHDIIQSDGIHPSISGHALIADTLLSTINELEENGVINAPSTRPAPAVVYLMGDANSDQKINISDATVIQKAVAGLVTFDSIASLCADTDLDTKVTVKDATQIQKHIAGLLSDSLIGTMIEAK